eukprot:TRINITY_DN51332_c0_g1_i1.p1 TRINITY_DN51332_c0_g1~~TRINITY_DN51332_c0_g1_i1.p1  ORF type:complete len:192 (-),score=23.43 TRINITY_DN51332_c0_g1_i1:165-740(-)
MCIRDSSHTIIIKSSEVVMDRVGVEDNDDEAFTDLREPYTPTESISEPPSILTTIVPTNNNTNNTDTSAPMSLLNVGASSSGAAMLSTMRSPLLGGAESSASTPMGVSSSPQLHATTTTLPTTTMRRSLRASQAIALDVQYSSYDNRRVFFGCLCCLCTGCLSCLPCCVWSVCIHPPLGGPPPPHLYDPMK